MSGKPDMTPEELIKQIEKQNLKISPIIDLTADIGDGRLLLACDCSGCVNPSMCSTNPSCC